MNDQEQAIEVAKKLQLAAEALGPSMPKVAEKKTMYLEFTFYEENAEEGA